MLTCCGVDDQDDRQTGDYFVDPSKTAFDDWAKVTLYRKGT